MTIIEKLIQMRDDLEEIMDMLGDNEDVKETLESARQDLGQAVSLLKMEVSNHG